MAEKQDNYKKPYNKNYKNNKNRKKTSQSSIGVWNADVEKEEKERREKRSNYKPRQNQNQNKNQNQQRLREDKIPAETIKEVIEYCTLLSVEQYFEDIGKESESFIALSRRMKFVKPAFLEKIQNQSDKIMEQEIKKLSKEFINSKVEITNYMRSIKVSDGFDAYLFAPSYEKGKFSIKTYHKVETE